MKNKLSPKTIIELHKKGSKDRTFLFMQRGQEYTPPYNLRIIEKKFSVGKNDLPKITYVYEKIL